MKRRKEQRIEHRGVVEAVNGSKARVRIVQSSACSGCHARHLCNSSESKEKIVDCLISGQDMKIGDEVMVYGSMSMGRKAVVVAFVVPLVIMIAVAFVSSGIFGSDSKYGDTLTVGMVIVWLLGYFMILSAFRNKLANEFVFRAEKI